jgi:predicted nucleotidyltransferase
MTDSVAIDLTALGGYLSQDARVIMATVFGSARNGIVKPGSDLDIGILFQRALAPAEFLEFYSDLCDQVPRVERVDLVVLDADNPILAFEAISGRLLCKNDLEKTAAFFSLICREYEDVMANLDYQSTLPRDAV